MVGVFVGCVFFYLEVCSLEKIYSSFIYISVVFFEFFDVYNFGFDRENRFFDMGWFDCCSWSFC